jgi:hypothetical protein
MSDTSEGDYTEGRMAYIDLLVHTLSQHEKRLDDLINRLEVSLNGKEPRSNSIENIIFTKIEIPYNRPVQDLTKILETITSK